MKLTLALAAYRLVHKVSIRKLAKDIGVDYTVLWKFEQGRQIESKSWVKIMQWLLTE